MNMLEYLEHSNKLDDSYFTRNFNMTYSEFFEETILLNANETYEKIEKFLEENPTFDDMKQKIENFLPTLSPKLEGNIDNKYNIKLKKKIVLYNDTDYILNLIDNFQFIKKSENYIITFQIFSKYIYSLTQEETLKESFPNDYEQKRNPFICQNYILSLTNKYFLSTVYLGKTDPFTISYETMLFDNSENVDDNIVLQERFRDKEKAKQFHAEKLKELLNGSSSKK